MGEQGSSNSDNVAYQRAFAALDELDLSYLKPLFKENHFRDKTLSFIKSEEQLARILKEEFGLPFGPRFEFSSLWFEKYHGNEVTTTSQAKTESKSNNNVQVREQGEEHLSELSGVPAVVKDEQGKKAIAGREAPLDLHEVAKPLKKAEIEVCVDVKKNVDKGNVAEMLATKQEKEDPADRQSEKTNELKQDETVRQSGSKWPHDDGRVKEEVDGKLKLKTASSEEDVSDDESNAIKTLDPSANDDKKAPKSTSIDADDEVITIEEKGVTSAANIVNSIRAVEDDHESRKGTAKVVNELDEITEKERGMDNRLDEKASKASNQQSSSQSNSKKKKMVQDSKGTGSPETITKSEEKIKEGKSSLEDGATMVADSPADGGAVEAAEFKLPLDNTAENVIRPQNSLTEKKNVVNLADNVRNTRKSKLADLGDRQTRNEENRANSGRTLSWNPALAADNNNNLEDTIAVGNVYEEIFEKERDMSEEANKSSGHQSSSQSKSKKKKTKKVPKGTASAGTITKDEMERKEGQAPASVDRSATAAVEATPTAYNTDEAAKYSGKNDDRAASLEIFFEDPSANQHASVLDTERVSRKEGKAYLGGSAQEVVSFASGASNNLTSQDSKSDQGGKRNVNPECESEVKQLPDDTEVQMQKKDSKDVARCTPRPHGVTGRDTFYDKGSVLDIEENREVEFKSLVSAQPCSLPWKIMEKAKKFICACLNADSKGIIYFGVGDSQEKDSKYHHGQILGLDVEDIKDDINKAFQFVLDDHIKSDAGPLQKGGEQKCVSIHFVPIKVQGKRSKLYVIEIEVDRDWRFCKDKIYYSKSWAEKRGADKDCAGKKALGDFFKVKDEFDDVAIRTNGASTCVKKLEVDGQVKKPLDVKYKEWRRKTKQGANEIPEEFNVEEADARRFSVMLRERLHELNHKEYGYILVANKLPAKYRGTPHLSFLQNIPWVAVFDLFDSSSKRDGLHYICNETTDAPRAKISTLDDFKEVTPDKDALLSTRGTTWILSNEEMQQGDWIKCSKDCLYRALSAYKQCFPPGRLVCVFLCFSESAVPEMADIMESSFSILGNSASSCVTIISETRPVAEAFIKASKLSLKKELGECSVTGIPWILLKEIVREMVGPSKFEERGATTELPYFTGQLKEVLNKIVHSWDDLEVYSPNPRLPSLAEAIEKERDAFYKGAQASQINLFHNHSILRSLEKDITSKVDRALKLLSKENVDANYHVKTVTVAYEPGSGATTLCRRILWNKRRDYRCAVVKAITSSTDYQIEKLQCIGYDEKNVNYSLPVLVLVDNFPESDVRLLTEHIMKRQTKCVVLTTLPISMSTTNSKFEITLGKLDDMETDLVKNILINITSDTERRREAEQVLEREKRFIWFGLELFGREYMKIKERLQNHIRSILMSFLGDSRAEHQMLLDVCCFLNKYSDGCVILPHSVVLDFLYETSSLAKRPDIQDVHEVFGGLLLEEQNETNGYYGWRPAHSLVSEVVTSRISVEDTAVLFLDQVCKGKAYVTKYLRQQVFKLFLDRKRISDPVFLEGQVTDDGAVGTDLENEVFGFYGKRTRYSPVIVDILGKESNIQGALKVLLTICEQATQTEAKAYAWQQLARFMGYEMRGNSMDKQDDLHERLYNAMRKEMPVMPPMPKMGIEAAHMAVDIAVSHQPSFTNHYTTKGGLYLFQLRDFKPPTLRSLPEAIEICRKALGVYDKALQTSGGSNHFSMDGKIQAVISLLEIVKGLPCFLFGRKFMSYLKREEEVPPEMAEVLSQDEQDYVQSLSSTTLDVLNELFEYVKLKQTTTFDENEIRGLKNAKIRASNLRRKFYDITGFDKRELSSEEYSMPKSPTTIQELALHQQKVQDILFFRDETPYSTWSNLSDKEVDFIYQLLKPLCRSGRGRHSDMLICSKACLRLKDRPPVDELDKIVTIWVEKCPNSEWAHLFYYMIHFPVPNGSLAPYNSMTKASIKKCSSIVQNKAGSGFRKSGAEYFLGKGLGLNAIVSSQEFRWLETKWKTKTEFWRGKEPSERLERVQGQKDVGSKGIISYQGIQLHFDETLYPNKSKDDLWFYVGFTVAGPYAYDPVDNDTYASLTRSTSRPTTSNASPERFNASDKLNISSSNHGSRGKVRLSTVSPWQHQDAASVQAQNVDENTRDDPEVSQSRKSRVRNRTQDDDINLDWGSDYIPLTVGGRFGALSNWASDESLQTEPEPGWTIVKQTRRQEKADEWKRYKKAEERRVEEEGVTNKVKRENLKSVVGVCGSKKKVFAPTRLDTEGKLHHGAFVLGVKKSQECLIHTNSRTGDSRVTDRCNFAHGWRGDTLQFVCTKCTEESLTFCKEKINHEQFIWNLGPYYNQRGEVWKDEKESR